RHGEAVSPHKIDWFQSDRGRVLAAGNVGAGERADGRRVVPRGGAGERERSAAEGGAGPSRSPGAYGRAGGTAGDLAQRALQVSERGEADGRGDATADRPGRLGQAEEGARAAGAGGWPRGAG